jgi:hypothetical protein
MKRIFQCKAIRYIKRLPDYDSASAHLRSLDLKFARKYIENRIHRREDPWQQPNFGPRVKSSICRPVAAVEEGVTLAGVAVEVAVDKNVPLFVKELEELLGVEDSRMQILLWMYPLPVEVDSSKV